MFEVGTAADYHELNAGAHRTPPKVLSAPSLVWHLAFWSNFQELGANGKPLKNEDGSPKKKTEKQINDALDRCVIALYHALVTNADVGEQAKTNQAEIGPDAQATVDERVAPVQLTPCIMGAYLLFGSAYEAGSFQPIKSAALRSRQRDIFEGTNRTVALQFVWRKLDVTIRFEVHTEHFSISTFVELDKERMKARTSAHFSSLPKLNDSIADILRYLNAKDIPARAGNAQPIFDKALPAEGSIDVQRSIGVQGADTQELIAAQESIDADVPPQLDDVLPSTPTPPSSTLNSEQLVISINKFCFHEFWAMYEQEVLSGEVLANYANDVIFKQIFADFRGFIASDQAIKFPADDFFEGGQPPEWGWAAKSRFLPLIQHRKRVERSRYECTVNYMLDGRAIYLSTLGPQLPSIPENQRIPVEFIVYAHQRFNDTTIVNKWQLGRLVNQILLLGTLQLCALKDVKLLREAGQQLGSLEESTQKARVAIALTEAYSIGADSGRLAQGNLANAQNRKAIAQIADAHRKLNDITGKFLDGTGTGPLYRIERSRYYVQQFEENVKFLRIKRLEGDQPYDQFIRRRLGSEFDFINRLGIRYERASASIVTLDQNYLAITQNLLVGRATTIDEETNSIQADIQAIQEWGEFALLSALVPYYVMHLLDLIITEKYVPVLTSSVWSVFGALALYRKFEKWAYVAVFMIVAVPIIAFLAAVLLLDPVSEGGILRAHGMPERQLHLQEELLKIQMGLKEATDEQLVVLKDLSLSIRKIGEPKPDHPVPVSPEPMTSKPTTSEPKP